MSLATQNIVKSPLSIFFFIKRQVLNNQYLSICLFGFLTSSSTTRLYRGRAPRQSILQFYGLPHMRQSWETMTYVSVGHIILTPTQPVGSGRPQRESNPGSPHQESRAIPTELPRPLKQPIHEHNYMSGSILSTPSFGPRHQRETLGHAQN